jgi:hypothetical protein
MNEFISKYESQIGGVVSGFDRLVFRGNLRSLVHGPCSNFVSAARECAGVGILNSNDWKDRVRTRPGNGGEECTVNQPGMAVSAHTIAGTQLLVAPEFTAR